MTDTYNFRESKISDLSSSPFRDSLPSKREDDKNLQNLFKDVVEERRSTQRTLYENFDRIIDAHNRKERTPLDSPLDSDLSMSRSGLHDYNPDGKSSNNTSALLDDNLDDLDTIEPQKAKENKRNLDEEKRRSTIVEEDTFNDGINTTGKKRGRGHNSSAKKDHINSSLSDSYEYNDRDDDFTLTKDYGASQKKKYDDETLGTIISPSKIYDSLEAEEELKRSLGQSKSGKKSKSSAAQNTENNNNLQISSKNINFGALYPTETKQETLEFVNKGNAEIKLELSIQAQKSPIKFFIITEDNEGIQKNFTSLVLSKYAFKTIKIGVEVGSYGLDNDKAQSSVNAALLIKNNSGQQEVSLNCRIESPALQVLETSIDKMVGNVPFIDFRPGNDNELAVPFKNNGSKVLLLEFELVGDSKLAEVIFSPKYLSIKEGEEKSLNIRTIRSFDYVNKKKAILKYRIKGTKLCQCIVINIA